MVAGLASLTFIPLLAISMVHLLWAFGLTYPAKDELTLARTVAGFRGIEKMPPKLASFGVAVATFSAGLWALALTDASSSLVLTGGGVVLTLVFLARGFIGYTRKWREMTPEEPFATFDKKLYSPLCIGIGTGFLVLTALRLF